MAPLITLILVGLTLWGLGKLPHLGWLTWRVALRGGLIAMFLLTGVSHFVGMRGDLIAMVPPVLPNPALLVTITGVLELAGAVGLAHRRTAPWAGLGLAVLLVGMFPANAYAALAGIEVGGEPAMDLVPRLGLQLVFLAATLVVAWPLRARLTQVGVRSRPERASTGRR